MGEDRRQQTQSHRVTGKPDGRDGEFQQRSCVFLEIPASSKYLNPDPDQGLPTWDEPKRGPAPGAHSPPLTPTPGFCRGGFWGWGEGGVGRLAGPGFGTGFVKKR